MNQDKHYKSKSKQALIQAIETALALSTKEEQLKKLNEHAREIAKVIEEVKQGLT